MKTTISAICALFITGIFAGSVNAQDCRPQFVQASQSINLTITEIGRDRSIREPFAIEVRNSGTGQCNASLRFSRQITSDPRLSAQYSINNAAQLIDILPTDVSAPSTASDVFVNGIPAGGSNGRTVPFAIEMPTQWGIASGQMSDAILVQLIDAAGQVVDSLDLIVNISVLPTVELRIVGATGQGRIAQVDLGALDNDRINRSEPLGIRVWSTSPYQVTYTSANAGALLQTGAPDRIEYDLRTDGTAVDLSGNRPSTFGQRTTSLGDLHPLEIVVPPFRARAGRYNDRVTITVSAN